jgi:hypothetical protein
MKATRWAVCLMALAGFGFGCCTEPDKTDFLTGNEKMQPGKYLEKWWTAGPIDKQTVSKLYIEPINVARIQDAPNISALYASNFLAQTIAYDIRASSSFVVVSNSSEATAKVTLAITYMSPGSAAGREFAGEFGMGDSIVQLEGKVTDASGKDIACFAHRRVDSGSAGFEDLGGDVGQRLVRRSLDYTCIKFVNELKAATSP